MNSILIFFNFIIVIRLEVVERDFEDEIEKSWQHWRIEKAKNESKR